MKRNIVGMCLSLLCLGQMCAPAAPRPVASPIPEGTYVGMVQVSVQDMIGMDVYDVGSATQDYTVPFGPNGLPLNDENQEISVGDVDNVYLGGYSVQQTVTSIVTNSSSVTIRYDATIRSPDGFILQGPSTETYTVTGSQTLRFNGDFTVGAVINGTWLSVQLTASGTLYRS